MTALILIAIAGFAAQLVDGGLGMGFGVTSTTLLISLAALTPATASAVVHTAEVGTTFVSGLSHWRFGNVDWKVVFKVGVPGAVGAFAGATFLSHISTEMAAPVTAAILAAIGIALVLRFSRGQVRRRVAGDALPQQHSAGFLGGLGLFGGFIDASGGGGWGPVTSSTLLLLGRNEPRRVVGTVNTAEFLVSLAATLGFVVGLWSDLVANLAAVAALLVGGVIAAPIAAWLISRFNPVVLGGVVGTFLVVLNAPEVLAAFGAGSFAQNVVRVVALVVGLSLSVYGAYRARRKQAATVLEGAPVGPASDVKVPAGADV